MLDPLMRWKASAALGVALSCTAAMQGTVRMAVKDGRTIIYNDGAGESAHEALRWSDAWLASRVAIPSLYDDLILSASSSNAIDPKLVKSVMLIESAFNPSAVSRKGARGLMQLMPETAAKYGVQNILDPEENIAGGVRYLTYLLTTFGGDVSKSLAAYNAGETAVARYGGIPPFDETRLYVRKGLTAYYGKATLGGGFGRPQSETWGTSRGRPVRLTRDRKNRPLITTDLSARPALRRG